MKQTPSDPVVDEIREVRHRISERFAHDARRLVAYYAALQEQYRERLLTNPDQREQHDPHAA
jgi:hypothetical protein